MAEISMISVFKFIKKYVCVIFVLLLIIAILANGINMISNGENIKFDVVGINNINPETQLTETFINTLPANNANNTNNTNTIYVERVTTPETIAKGLMFRNKPLKQNHGMLFDKGAWSSSGFWMKNTYIPLDILFLDENFTVIDILYDMIPFDTISRNINKPWRYAIEINAGSMRHIIPGTYVNVIELT